MEYNESFEQGATEKDRLLQLIQISQSNLQRIEKLQQTTEHDLVNIRDKFEECFLIQASVQKKYKEMRFLLLTDRNSSDRYVKRIDPITFRAVYKNSPRVSADKKTSHDITYISMTKKLKTNRVVLSRLGIEGAIGTYQLDKFILTSSNLFLRKISK